MGKDEFSQASSSRAASSIPSITAALFSKPSIQLVLIALIGLLAYSNTFHVPFVFDDEGSIVENHVIKDLGNFLSGAGYSYNPRRFVGYLTIALNYRLGGLNVTGYHIFNLAVHITSAWLVYAFVRLTLQTPFFGIRDSGSGARDSDFETQNSKLETRNFVPLLAALLFVAHPVQTQAVTYIVQRLASLAAMSCLLSVVLYVWARLVQEAERKAFTGKAPALYILSLTAAACAMKTKETAFTLPFIIVLYEFLFFKMSLRKKLVFLLPVILTVVIVPLSLLGTGKPIGELISDVAEKTRVQTDMPRLDYLFTQFRVIVTYLRLLILPVNQNLDYDYPIYRSFFTPPVFLSFLLLLALFGVAVWLCCRSGLGTRDQIFRFPVPGSRFPNPGSRFTNPESRLIAFGILWFFITISVESSFIPIVDVIFEHRLYLPSVGAFIAVSTLAALVLRNTPPRRAILAVTTVVLILAAATFARNSVWTDPVTLAKDIVKKSPAMARPHYNLALALDQKGRYDEAIREAGIAAGLTPEEAKPYNLIGSILVRRGMYNEAIAEFTQAVRLDPKAAYAHSNLGYVYLVTGLTQRAMEHFFIAMRLAPNDPEIYNAIGTAYSISSDRKEAAAFFRHAVRMDPSRPDYRLNLRKAEAAGAPVEP